MAISETPVTLPLGRDRLLTKPVATGSPPDSVYVARHEILGKLWQLLSVDPAGTDFERHIAIGDVAMARQTTHHRVKNGLRVDWSIGTEDPDAIDL
jgi:hypothetical protein